MRSRNIPFGTIRSSTIIMDGGLNENKPSVEMSGGELSSVVNYMLYEGSQGGYVSTKGYERFDGQTSPSSIDAFGLPFLWDDGLWNVSRWDDEGDVLREAARDLIGEVPGEGSILGLYYFKDTLYVFRNKVGGLTAGMYKSSVAGWVEVDTSAAPLEPSGNYIFTEYNFKALSDSLSMIWVDGVNKARVFDGTTIEVSDNSGLLTLDKPINLAVHNERLFLAYEGGYINYTEVGDPLLWTGTAGELGIGREITNLISSVGNTLIIFCDEAIKLLKGTADTSTWTLETFHSGMGAYTETAVRLLGSIFFMDDRGVIDLRAVQEFGDFGSSTISQNIQRTLYDNKDKITVASVHKEYNQYRLFLNNGVGIYFSFKSNQFRGITFMKFPRPVMKITTGEDSVGNVVSFFASDTGYVYQMDIGTSFDSEPINTRLTTTYYHYGSPRNWKRFKSMSIEIDREDPIALAIRPDFDYGDPSIPRGTTGTIESIVSAGYWGEGVYGVIRYSSSLVNNRSIYYIKGVGSNMNLSIAAASKYNKPHTIQNITVDYELSRRQL